MTEVRIEENDAGQTLEKYLRKAFRQLPKGMMFKAIRNKKIKVNRKRADPKQLLETGDTIQLFLPPDVLESGTFVPNDRPVEVLYEDEDLLAVYKPAGLLSQKDQPGPQDDLNSRIRSYLYRSGAWDPEKDRSFLPSVAHRLDRNTAGIVLAGKSAAGARRLSELIREGKVEKHYHALVQGEIREPRDIRLWLKKDGIRALVSDEPQEGYQEARMRIRPLAHRNGNTLLDVDLQTGRFHQIRACMAYLGHPLAGDVKYGGSGQEGYVLEAYEVKVGGKTISCEKVK